MRVHRLNLALTLVGSFALQGTQLAFIGVLLGTFGPIAGWGISDVAFLYGMRLAAHGICTTSFGQHRMSAIVVREGEWDRYLVRPVGGLMQLLTRAFNAGSLGDLGLGLTILVVAASQVDISWNAGLILFLVVSVISGGLVEAGVQVGISGLDFRIGPTARIKDTVDTVFTNFGAYPMSIFGSAFTWILTFALPLAFMAYLPATVLLDRTVDLVVPVCLAWASPIAGPISLAAGVAFFSRMSRFYASPGH